MDQQPRKHHYIPSFYLRRWVSPPDGRLCEYKRLPSGRVVVARRHPEATGYRTDLYRLEHVPAELSQIFEHEFMKLVDSGAHLALEKLTKGGAASWSDAELSSWARFLLSLRFRNPESVSLLKKELVATSNAAIDRLKRNYLSERAPDDPPTVEEYLAHTEKAAPYKAALILLQEIIDNPNMAKAIMALRWARVPVPESRLTLLTSDRPLEMPHGLSAREAYLAIPIGPKLLFVAAHSDSVANELANADPTAVVKRMNEIVVEQARQFVWGVDDGQRQFVQNRIARRPDSPIISEKARRAAMDVAANVPLLPRE